MKAHFLITLFILGLSLAPIISCTTDKPKKHVESKPKKHLTEAEKADLERGSFDQLPDHNDSITGCWTIDKKRSFSQLWNLREINGFFFFEEHKRFSIYDSSQYTSSESRIGFYRFYKNELTFEITDTERPFQDVWRIKFQQGMIIAENKLNPNQILYLKKVNKKSDLSYK